METATRTLNGGLTMTTDFGMTPNRTKQHPTVRNKVDKRAYNSA